MTDSHNVRTETLKRNKSSILTLYQRTRQVRLFVLDSRLIPSGSWSSPKFQMTHWYLTWLMGGREMHKLALFTAYLFSGQGKLGLVIQTSFLLKKNFSYIFMCTIIFHRSKGESKNMKCNVFQTWLKKPQNFAELEFHRTSLRERLL